MRGGTIVSGLLVVLILAGPAVTRAAPDQPGPVYFQELLWSGSDRSSADEWLVLGNATEQLIDLTGWRLTRRSNQAERLVTVLDGLLIAPHGTVLITNNDHDHQFAGGPSALAIQPDLIVPSLSLSNSQLELRLYPPQTALAADVAGNGQAPPAGSTKPPASMQRRLPLVNGALATSWQTATDRRNIDPESTVLATPTHAGRPRVERANDAPVPIDESARFEITVDDPDGDDDVAAVVATCDGEPITLQDTGLGGDRVAGDRIYTALRQRHTNERCVVRVVDRQTLMSQQTTDRQVYVRSAPLRISELLPAPTGGDEEAIELTNHGDAAVSLAGWSLDDTANGGSPPFDLSGLTVAAGGYLVLTASQSRLRLNDDGDEVRLVNPEGSVTDTTSYRTAPKGASWSYDGERWAWTMPPSLGRANPPAGPEPVPVTAPVTASPVLKLTAAAIGALAPGTPVRLTAVVIAAPRMLSASTLIVADSSGVVELYRGSQLGSELTVGSVITVTGRRSATRYARLILDSYQPDQSAVRSVPEPLSKALETPVEGARFVAGEARLVRRNRRSLTVAVADRVVRVLWPATLPDASFDSALQPGATLAIQGILTVTASTDEPTLTLREPADLTVLASPPPPPVPAALDLSPPTSTGQGIEAAPLLVPIPPAPRAATRPLPPVTPPVQPPPALSTTLERTVRLLMVTLDAAVLTVELHTRTIERQIRGLTSWIEVVGSAMVIALFVLATGQALALWTAFDRQRFSSSTWPGG